MSKKTPPKVLFLDIETAPIVAYVWGLFDQNIAPNQIVEDTFILSWCAKWSNRKTPKYKDLRKFKKPKDDKSILKDLHKMMSASDIIVGQNVKKFDIKRINARFLIAGLPPIDKPYKQHDTLVMSKKTFSFTSNKLEFLTAKLNKKYKKLKHTKFPGMELWTECMKGNKAAWREMQKYNTYDVLALEELYNKIVKWDKLRLKELTK